MRAKTMPRRQAEKKPGPNKARPAGNSTEAEARKLAQELEVHQIVLEMQIEELKRAVTETEAARNKYSKLYDELYDFAPVGYYALDGKGKILRANLTGASLLDIDRAALIGKRFQAFVKRGSRTMFDELLRSVSADSSRKKCEVELVTPAGFRRRVHVDADVDKDGNCRATVIERTKQWEAEDALRASEVKYRCLFETMAEGVVYQDLDGRITSVNPAAQDILGLSLDQITGRTSSDPLWRPIHEDGSDFPAETHPAMMALKTGKAVRNVCMGILNPRENRYRWININAIPQFQAGDRRPIRVYMTFQDITERKRAEEELRESEERFRRLSEAPFEGIVFHEEGRIIDANKAFATMFGYSLSEIIGKNALDFASRELREAALAHIRTGSEEPYEGVVTRKDGSTFPVEVHSMGAPYKGRIIRLTAVRDIEERKKAEKELKDSHAKLRNLAIHLLHAREEERKNMSQEIHDELGQVLTAIKMDLRWLEKRIDPSQEKLQEKMRGMIDLTDQTIRRIQRISAELRPRMLDDLGLAAAIDWLGGDFSRRTGVPCEVIVEATDSRMGGNDTTAVFRIIQEALTNVARHARASFVSVQLRDVHECLEVLIQDNGIGITAEQASGPKSFGLIGIWERVQELHGEVSIRGEAGKGTSVLVRIPLPREEAPT